MYICSTGSIPIAASLLLKGMSPGAALVFLLAGPATNAVTMTVVAKELGKRAVIIYVGAIAVMSILLGILFDIIAKWVGISDFAKHIHSEMLPARLHEISSILLGMFILFAIVKSFIPKRA